MTPSPAPLTKKYTMLPVAEPIIKSFGILPMQEEPVTKNREVLVVVAFLLFLLFLVGYLILTEKGIEVPKHFEHSSLHSNANSSLRPLGI
jgi:hypothetical protein